MVQQDIDNDFYFYCYVHFYRNFDNAFLHSSRLSSPASPASVRPK